MPEMDGLEATAAIREWERTAGRHTPIVAMTAHAMAGDRERCLGAGMDAYIAKPIRAKDIADAIVEIVKHPAERDAGDVIDSAALLAGVGGDRQLLSEMAALFATDSVEMLSKIQAAVEQQDAPQLHRAAHALKGAIGNFGAKAAFGLAQQLEILGREHDLRGAGAACLGLERELTRLRAALQQLTKAPKGVSRAGKTRRAAKG